MSALSIRPIFSSGQENSREALRNRTIPGRCAAHPEEQDEDTNSDDGRVRASNRRAFFPVAAVRGNYHATPCPKSPIDTGNSTSRAVLLRKLSMRCRTACSFMTPGNMVPLFGCTGCNMRSRGIPEHPKSGRQPRLMRLGTLCQSRHQLGVLTMLGNSIIFLTSVDIDHRVCITHRLPLQLSRWSMAYELSALVSTRLALKVNTRRALIVISFPVCGLRPGRAFLSRTTKLPKPEILIFSFFSKVFFTVSNTVSTIAMASFFENPPSFA